MMKRNDVRVGQRLYDKQLDAYYKWIHGTGLLCDGCQWESPIMLKWDNPNDSTDTTIFCVSCAGIESLAVIMEAVKEEKGK